MSYLTWIKSPKLNNSRNLASVALLIALGGVWPIPVIVGKIEASIFQHKCETLWQENVTAFQSMDTAKNEVDYVGSGLNFTHPWTTDSSLWESSCFRHLTPEHLLAIQHFEGALLEYSRQSELANFGMAAPMFDYPQYSRVQFICRAPILLELRWKASCETFLNVP